MYNDSTKCMAKRRDHNTIIKYYVLSVIYMYVYLYVPFPEFPLAIGLEFGSEDGAPAVAHSQGRHRRVTGLQRRQSTVLKTQ